MLNAPPFATSAHVTRRRWRGPPLIVALTAGRELQAPRRSRPRRHRHCRSRRQAAIDAGHAVAETAAGAMHSDVAYASPGSRTAETEPRLLVPAVDVKRVDGRGCGPGRCRGGAWACCGIGMGPRTPRLTLALDAGWFPVGYMMWWGVPADGLRPLGLTRPLLAGRGRQQGCGNWPRFIGDWWACRVTVG